MLAACVAQSRKYVASGGLLVVDLFRIHHRSARIVVPFRDNGVIRDDMGQRLDGRMTRAT
jgi:hypothetical protein